MYVAAIRLDQSKAYDLLSDELRKAKIQKVTITQDLMMCILVSVAKAPRAREIVHKFAKAHRVFSILPIDK